MKKAWPEKSTLSFSILLFAFKLDLKNDFRYPILGKWNAKYYAKWGKLC
jgi:hypothetical protein